MAELLVVVVSQDNEHRAILQVLVDGTSVARVVHTCASYPVVANDPVVRRIQSASPEVVLVDVPVDNPANAVRSIEILHQELRDPAPAIFAIGSMSQPQVIVSATKRVRGYDLAKLLSGSPPPSERRAGKDLAARFIRSSTPRVAAGQRPRPSTWPWLCMPRTEARPWLIWPAWGMPLCT